MWVQVISLHSNSKDILVSIEEHVRGSSHGGV
jgi:hypothetical protein